MLTKIKLYVNELFTRRNLAFLKYHNLHHTETVVDHALEISSQYFLTEQERFSLMSAAWFHDTGHLFNELEDHEQTGADLMGAYLKSLLIGEELIQEIADCILVTKMPSSPKNMIEKIICDADTYHFGTKEFLITDPLIYEELEARLAIHIENRIQKSIRLLESHQFYTTYCQDLLDKGKNDNLDILRRGF